MSLSEKQIEWGAVIWTELSRLFDNNFYAVAGFMGNIQAESGLCPYRLQGDYTYGDDSANPYPRSLSYSHRLSETLKGQIVEEPITSNDFVHHGPGGGGFGLAQWTYYSRKQRYVDFYKEGGGSERFPCIYSEDIGSIQNGANFLCYELETFYSKFTNELKECTSIREVSDRVLHDYERPADQSESVEITRYQLGYEIYQYFSVNQPPSVKRGDLVDVVAEYDNSGYHLYAKYSEDTKLQINFPDLMKNDTQTDEAGKQNLLQMIGARNTKGISNFQTNKEEIILESCGLKFDPHTLFFVNGIMMPLSCPLNYLDKYFNDGGNGGVSRCCRGDPQRKNANVLNNCVGGAWAAYNWSFFNTLNWLDESICEETKKINNFLHSPGNGNSCLVLKDGSIAYGLNSASGSFSISGEVEQLSAYLIHPDEILGEVATATPPVGGLISWGYTANHVAFIVDYIDDYPSGDGTLYVIESGYDSPDYTWVLRTYLKSNKFRYNNCQPVAFLANPVVSKYTNIQPFKEVSIHQYSNLRDLKITFSPVFGEFKFVNDIYCEWYKKDLQSETLLGSSTFFLSDEDRENNYIKVKKIRSSNLAKIRVTYCNSFGTLKQSDSITEEELVPSYPAFLMNSANYGQVFTPILNRGNNLPKEALVPVIRKNNKNLAFFAYKPQNSNSYKFILEEL